MTLTGTILGFRSHLRSFARDREAVAAVEFAIILPFMLLMYIGSVELGDGLAIDFKVTETARSVTDLTSQYVSVDTATMSSILGASSTVVAPYPSSNMVVTVSEVEVLANSSTGTISWSCSLNGTPHTTGQSLTLPTTLQNPATTIWLIRGEVTYPYTPSIGYVVTGTITMYQSTYFYPRMSLSVAPPTSWTAPVSCST
jgi:Flp pilus assembly protein TadG